MLRQLAISSLIGTVMLAAPEARAGSIAGLFTTGVDSAGHVLGLGVADPHYIGTDGAHPRSSAVTVTSIPGSYVPNNSTSLWEWENANGQPTNVTRIFQTTFDLTGFDPSTAIIHGTWATDNFGLNILINGVSTGQTSPGFSSFTSFTISPGFVLGLNTIDFVVQDVGDIAAFRVGMLVGTAASAVPEPSAFLMALTAVGLNYSCRIRRTWKMSPGC
jgi:hypothetical protein